MSEFTSTPQNKPAIKHKVLILTGGLLTEKETSLFHALQKQSLQMKHSKNAWLDLKLKVLTGELIITSGMRRIIDYLLLRIPGELRKRFLSSKDNVSPPELTEVVLATLLTQHNVNFELASISDIFSNKAETSNLLLECDCVFFSTTFLRDFSELEPLIRTINRPHNHIVLGGALTSLIHKQWQGIEGVDILAVGYGELLIATIVDWIQSSYTSLEAPATGSLQYKNSTYLLYSGLPKSKSLDFLPRPDWKIASRYHKKTFNMIYYESVRGCPYKCSFCNYPFLFDDNKFRYFSAERIANDWQLYINELNIKYITCLDSLFTMPKQRLIDLCNILIEKKIKVKWICYARADDLANEETVRLMKQAGAHQVQIGLESGHPDILNNMNKRCTVEANARAINNCEKHGLTTVVSLIIGFPGETKETLQATYEFLKANPPDFYYLAAFSVRATKAPILSRENRSHFNLEVSNSIHTMAPYWQHNTMDCIDASDQIRAMNQRLMRNKISLNAVLFYSGLLHYRTDDRNILLQHQRRIATKHPVLRGTFSLLNKWINRKANDDIQHCFSRNDLLSTATNAKARKTH